MHKYVQSIQLTKFFLCLVPESESASLLFSTQSSIQRVSLDGDVINSVKLINSHALEFSHRNRSVCYIHHNVTSSNICCFDIDDFDKKWVLPKPSIFSNLDCKHYSFFVSTLSLSYYLKLDTQYNSRFKKI